MKTFQITITLNDEEIKRIEYFKSGTPENWDSLEEVFGSDYSYLCNLLDYNLINWCGRNLDEVAITDFGKQVLNQLTNNKYVKQ